MHFWIFYAILSAQKKFSPKIFVHPKFLFTQNFCSPKIFLGEARHDTMLPSILVFNWYIKGLRVRQRVLDSRGNQISDLCGFNISLHLTLNIFSGDFFVWKNVHPSSVCLADTYNFLSSWNIAAYQTDNYGVPYGTTRLTCIWNGKLGKVNIEKIGNTGK